MLCDCCPTSSDLKNFFAVFFFCWGCLIGLNSFPTTSWGKWGCCCTILWKTSYKILLHGFYGWLREKKSKRQQNKSACIYKCNSMAKKSFHFAYFAYTQMKDVYPNVKHYEEILVKDVTNCENHSHFWVIFKLLENITLSAFQSLNLQKFVDVITVQ